RVLARTRHRRWEQTDRSRRQRPVRRSPRSRNGSLSQRGLFAGAAQGQGIGRGWGRGVAGMLDDQRPCSEVLQQLASIQAAIRGVSKTVLRSYLERCASDAIRSDDPKVYDQLMDAIYKFSR
ncbi:MAG: metal-sensitive transcriptional regulator, partial [Phycisphaerales bacterium]|nr:metal-sensitive transcriptional regulator [Phycisphaerales bacterium]